MDEYPDADLAHPWAGEHRIPIIAHFRPDREYLIALVDPRTGPFGRLVYTWPGEVEAALIGSAIGYRRAAYTEHWQQRMLQRPLDTEAGINTLILAKFTDGWRYTQPSRDFPWTGRVYPPDPAGLVTLLDEALNWDWPEWKAAHPEAFATLLAQSGHEQNPGRGAAER
jgi:hypothetical protein